MTDATVHSSTRDSATAGGAGGNETQERQRLLIVDDRPINIMMASAELADLCDVTWANTGALALNLAHDLQPDVILLDVCMPGMDGFELCRHLKASPETSWISIIFLTANQSAESEELGLNLGAVDYIQKPFNAPVLRARVRNHLTLQQQRRQLEAVSMTDALTQLTNRRGFDQRFEREWQHALRLRSPLSLVLIDIDCFKQLNDSMGHDTGDVALRTIAKVIGAEMRRQTDLAARYGGEEFACLLVNTDEEGASGVAEKLRSGIERRGIRHPASSTGPVVTASIGYAGLIPSEQSSRETLFRLADSRLYRAKRGGRNRCVGDDTA